MEPPLLAEIAGIFHLRDQICAMFAMEALVSKTWFNTVFQMVKKNQKTREGLKKS